MQNKHNEHKQKKQITKKKKNKRAPRDPHETLTLKYWLIGLALILLIAGIVVLSAFLAANAETVKFTLNEGSLVRAGDQKIYLKAPSYYEVRYLLDEKRGFFGSAYGVAADGDGKEMNVYRIGFENSYEQLMPMDSENYLATEDYTFYYGNYVTLPDLSNFSADAVRFGEEAMENGKKIRVFSNGLYDANTPDATDFINGFLQQERYVGDGLPQKTYVVEVTSEKYPYLAYFLNLVECDNGDYYLYSDENKSASIAIDPSWYSHFPTIKESTTDGAAGQ